MKNRLSVIILSAAGLLFISSCNKNNSGTGNEVINDTPVVKLGAYYFGGWYEGASHLKPALINNHPERQPVWGWVTQTPDIMVKEIDAAADAGIHFFSFCWYFNTTDLSENRPATQAIYRYLSAPNKNRLKFCILIANHAGYTINTTNWPALKEHWKKLVKEPSCLTVDGKPLIIFFDYGSLVTGFGSKEALKTALNALRQEVKDMGLPGLMIASCSSPTANSIKNVTDCGFDLLTGYNHHSTGFSAEMATPVDSMVIAEYTKVWPAYTSAAIPYIPVSTLNWDVRPWSDTPEQEKYYTGYSKASVVKSVSNIKKWILEHPGNVTKENIGLLYAWNEYGEGAWLSPSVALKDSLLQGVKQAWK